MNDNFHRETDGEDFASKRVVEVIGHLILSRRHALVRTARPFLSIVEWVTFVFVTLCMRRLFVMPEIFLDFEPEQLARFFWTVCNNFVVQIVVKDRCISLAGPATRGATTCRFLDNKLNFLNREFALSVVDVKQEVDLFARVVSVFVESYHHRKLGSSETAATANKLGVRLDDVVHWCEGDSPTNENHLVVVERRDSLGLIGPVVTVDWNELRAEVVVDFAEHGLTISD